MAAAGQSHIASAAPAAAESAVAAAPRPRRELPVQGDRHERTHRPDRAGPDGGAPAGAAAADRAKAAVAVGVDDPQRQPSPAQPRRAEGRRTPGVLRLGDLDHGGAVFRDPAAAGPRGGEAACRAGVPRDELPVRPADPGKDGGAARVRRRAAVSEPGQGRAGGGFLHRLGRPRRGHDQLFRADGRLRAAARAGADRICRRAGTSPSPATPSSTRATSTRRCWRAGSTTSATSGGSSTTTARAWTAWCRTGCSAASRACSATWAGTW